VQRARTLIRVATPELPGSVAPGLFLSWPRLQGRLVELSEAAYHGAVTALCPLLAEVQARGDLIAWVEAGPTVFFPPDLVAWGLDIEALTVVWAPGVEGWQATDWLLRCGAFALLVVDGLNVAEEGTLGKLARLAEDREAAVVLLTHKREEAPSLGSAVSLRLGVRPVRQGLELAVLRDKRSEAREPQRMTFDGPLGVY